MRFHANGPSIPDILLERRDRGRVVFLCGAGVSMPSKMPGFKELTERVATQLDPDEESSIAKLFETNGPKGFKGPKGFPDQIFQEFIQEYGREEVSKIVAQRLRRLPSSVPDRMHKHIAQISVGADRKPQIVTTNIDRLFEDDLNGATEHIQPSLPDITRGESVGVTYLHGKLPGRRRSGHDYILSSGDFGRAYLAEGWATGFMKSLLDEYTVVMLGYQAEDPLIKYLLQGFEQLGRRDESNLFVFTTGPYEEVERKWLDLGVTPMIYDQDPSGEHRNLWDSIKSWADQAKDPEAWQAEVIESSRLGPRGLAPHERGQVAHLVRTTSGARRFEEANPSPPTEWLCVFDASCRARIKIYRLDDDPQCFPDTDRSPFFGYEHILGWCSGDPDFVEGHRLAGRKADRSMDIPPRLAHLGDWMLKHLNDPCTAWWMARQVNGIHPRHLIALEHRLVNWKNLHPLARNAWSLIRETLREKRDPDAGMNRIDLLRRIKEEGWSASVLQAFDDAMRPILAHKPPSRFEDAMPPLGVWEDVHLEDIRKWEVRLPDPHSWRPGSLGDVLVDVFLISEKHLKQAVRLHHAIGTKADHFKTPTCYPNDEVGWQRIPL